MAYTGTELTGGAVVHASMETPADLAAIAGNEAAVTITRREYDEESVIAMDFGLLDGEPTVDVVGDTAIVVVGGGQFEFEVPADATDVTVNDGILSIRG